jgi:DNA end-binding protein Ku
MGTPVWKGRIAYNGRSFAAKILTGARAESISFNQLHRHDLSRVKQVLHCEKENKPVPRDELVRGYEHGKDEFVVLEEDEIKALSPAAPDVIDLTKFVRLAQVDPLYFESSYYVAPAGDEVGYAALFGTLRKNQVGGLAKICLYTRERPLLFRAGTTGIIAHSLFYAHELRTMDQFRTRESAASEAELVATGRGVRALLVSFDDVKLHDQQFETTGRLIAAKVAAKAKPVSNAARTRTAA